MTTANSIRDSWSAERCRLALSTALQSAREPLTWDALCDLLTASEGVDLSGEDMESGRLRVKLLLTLGGLVTGGREVEKVRHWQGQPTYRWRERQVLPMSSVVVEG